MIRVTVEIVPRGTGTPKILGVAEIVNTGRGTDTNGEYRAIFYGKGGRIWRTAFVTGFKRKRDIAWTLLKLCLNATEKMRES